MKRALISLADKRGLLPFAQSLLQAGYELVSSSGTAAELIKNKIPCIEVSDLTGFPEIMGGRVKTLHPKIHGAILGRRDIDNQIMQDHQIIPIDLVAVNLYPFAKTLAQHPGDHPLLIENIDIGGPALLRAAAKNHQWVTVVVDPDDYPQVIASLDAPEQNLAFREKMAAKAFSHTSQYDSLIASYLAEHSGSDDQSLQLLASHGKQLRYGENSHQQGKLYTYDTNLGWGGVRILQGKELSYNNIADSDAAWSCLQEVDKAEFGAICVIVKHANPCAVATASTAEEAYKLAFAADSESAFGGILAFSNECDESLAQAITSTQFAEVILAPSYTEQARKVFSKKPNLRLLVLPDAGLRGKLKSVAGGVLWQSDDTVGFDIANYTQVTKAKSQPDTTDMALAWLVVKHLKSNAIALVKNGQTIGLGVGQTSRVKALRQALKQARDFGFTTEGCTLASDAFFPFADSIEIAAEYGVEWVVQPGGSIRDKEVIEAAQKHSIGMYLTGVRHFYH